MSKVVHAVGVIFEDEQGRILVLRRHPEDPEGDTWGLVGGKVDPGEDATKAALREVEEEIGHVIDPSQLQFVRAYHWPREDLDLTFDVFKLNTPTGEVTVELDHTESTMHMWAQPKDLVPRKDLMVGLYPILSDMYSLR